MASLAAPASFTAPAVSEPFPIFKLAHRFLLYDATTISYIRAKYNICGVLIGGLPQAPQQNVFLGIPLELMPEEARLLVENKVAFIVDDVKEHKHNFLAGNLDPQERKAYQAVLRKQGQAAADLVTKRTDDRKKAALQKKVDDGDWNDIPEDMLKPRAGIGKKKKNRSMQPTPTGTPMDSEREDNDGLLFAAPKSATPADSNQSQAASSVGRAPGPEPYAVTPTTSCPPLRVTSSGIAYSCHGASDVDISSALPTVPSSYPLFHHMHDKGYFMSPGLRFGCQYMAYPGDPLRFHSHFLCDGMDWDKEFDLLDIVGGGRLGTGVKKGFLIGGQEKSANSTDAEGGPGVRTFCIEWGGM